MKTNAQKKDLNGISAPKKVPIPARFKKATELPQTQKEITRKVKNPDVVVTMLQNAIDDSGMETTKIAANALLSWKTVNNIVEGKTSRPQNYTCEQIFNVCGYERLVRKKG